MPQVEPFEQHPDRYDHWFEQHPHAFDAEVRALRPLVPHAGRGLEIGVGTGQFAEALGVEEGIDPSPEMRRRAQKRGIRVKDGVAEQLQYDDNQFDYALLVTTICFVDDVEQALAEAFRVLKPGGALIIGMVDRESPIGQQYEANKEEHAFYHAARFHAAEEVVQAMRAAGFRELAYRQTIFSPLDEIDAQEPVRSGYGEGAFVAIRGRTPTGNGTPSTTAAQQDTTDTREIRHNRVTGRSVVIAPSRSSRPRKTKSHDAAETTGPDPDCPFCPGNEERLPTVIDEQPAFDDKPWQTRAVPNKYAALVPSPPSVNASDPLCQRRTARGRQEVIIETPEHGLDLADLSVSEVETVVATYQRRYRAMRATEPELFPFVFRNYGAEAGASIAHAHSQLIATAHPPDAVQAEEERAQAYFDDTGRCLYCDIADREAEGPRCVEQTDHFVAAVPFAAEVPCEVMILPRAHRSSFVALDGAARTAFARMLRGALRRVRAACDDPSYNFYVRTPLHPSGDVPHLHWYLRLVPRTVVTAGFEWSTDLRINPSSPEADAARLRHAAP